MYILGRFFFSAVFFVLFLLNFLPVAAAIDEMAGEEMIVTGSHHPISLDKFGSSYSLITREQIERQQALFVSDLLRGTPGLAVSHTGVRGSQVQVRLRGAEANQVLVLIDGMRVNDIVDGDEFNFAHLLTENVERIEIIRGPQSALYGSDAIAGVINIISKKGGGKFPRNVFFETGLPGRLHLGGRFSKGHQDRYLHLNSSYLDMHGNNIAPQGDEVDGYEQFNLSIAAGMRLSPHASLDLIGRYIEADNEYDQQTFSGVVVDADNLGKTRRQSLRGQFTFSLLQRRWQHAMGAMITASENQDFAASQGEGSAQGRKYRFDYQSTFYLTSRDLEEGPSHSLTFSFDHERDRFVQQGEASIFGDPNQRQYSYSSGYVLGYQADLWEHFFLSASARYDDSSDFEDAYTYRTTAAYQYPAAAIRLHASYGTAIKRPTFIERFGFYPDQFIGNPGLNPELSTGWDVGIDKLILAGRARLSLGYFQARLEQEIVTRFDLPFSTVINLDETSRQQGIEFSMELALDARSDLSANYTWLEATEADSNGLQLPEIRRPRNLANLYLNRRFMHGKANLNLGIHHNGSQQDLNFATMQRVRLASYTVFNLAFSWRVTRQLEWYARIDNLFDRDYQNVFGFETEGVNGSAGVRLYF